MVDTPGQILVRRTKRLWTDEEKRSICFQTAAPGVSVAQVARRYGVDANMVFKWLRDPRYARAREVSPADVPTFLSVEIVDQHRNTIMPPVRAVALGRKNYLFVGSEAGGKAAAIAYTLIETAKLNAVDPHAWLADTLARIPDYKITKGRRSAALALEPIAVSPDAYNKPICQASSRFAGSGRPLARTPATAIRGTSSTSIHPRLVAGSDHRRRNLPAWR